jgi:N-acetylmuramoyl-L-alanine amidase
MVVLGALVAAMTVTSGLLMYLEPGPAVSTPGVALQSIDRTDRADAGDRPQDKLFSTVGMQIPWKSIVIHDSRTPQGSAKTLNRVHKQLGRGGLGYHFVIDNGPGSDDGKIEIGFRWANQAPGRFFDAETAVWPDAIGICLIGDGEADRFTDAQLSRLIWLVQQLQERYGIGKESVYAQIGSRTATSGFPDAWFRQQLLNK